MSAGANFFVCSCAILTLAIINLNVGPCVSGYNSYSSWSLVHCGRLSDELSDLKTKDATLKEIEQKEMEITKCRNKKAMYNMEYVSFIFNLIIGFICSLLGLYSLQNGLIPIGGMLGMVLGVIGLVLTFVYVVLNGIVYTNYYDSKIIKIDGDAAFAELQGDKYKCLYFNKENDTEALYAKYSDLIKSQYNYNKELKDYFDQKNEKENPEKYGCNVYNDRYKENYIDPMLCANEQFIDKQKNYTNKKNNEEKCEKLYYYYYYSGYFQYYYYYDKSARFLTTLIMSLFTVLCHCGLAFSGFMVYKESSKI